MVYNLSNVQNILKMKPYIFFNEIKTSKSLPQTTSIGHPRIK